jgi:D-aspartate ligase
VGRGQDAGPPVIVLAPPRFVAPLGVIRSLRRLGARVHCLRTDEPSIAGASRWCAGQLAVGRNGRPAGLPEAAVVEQLLAAGRKLSLPPGGGGRGWGGTRRPILLAGSDEWAILVADHADELRPSFAFPETPAAVVRAVTSKAGLHRLATEHGVPTPRVLVPTRADEVAAMADELRYPVMLKPVVSLPGEERVALVHEPAHLLERYQAMGGAGHVLLQEYVPGDDRDIWMFNGYFDRASRCLAGFTARKVRQLPPGMGLCAIGVCERNAEVERLTEGFLSAIGYQGVVDVDYRWDRRDGTYKVLDVNPRLGGAFRLMVDRRGLDVARAMYLDLTGRPVPAVEPVDGRRWLLEAADLLAFRDYRRAHGLTFGRWLRSLRGVEEGATFSWTDPLPFLVSMRVLAADTFGGRWRRASGRARASIQRLRQSA